MTDAVDESVLLGEESGRHARVEDEGYKGEEVRESHGAADGREGWMRGRGEIVPCDEAVSRHQYTI